MSRRDCIAMLLAGGEGRRLGVLTRSLAKPAVPFGGKYRIIDFTLSNCTNSGIDTVGVLTQYQPLVLHSYLGIGSTWDLDRINGGVTVLPPFVRKDGGSWYKGTANAVYQNIPFIKQYDPEYVLIISGDHIYKMNYDAMLQDHIEHEADVSIAAIEVPWDEASRFGILNVDADQWITEFQEKPAFPKTNLASMGIYIFKWNVLKEYLRFDEQNADSSHDFGKDVIPHLLRDGKKLFAYAFQGYWKDVGTIESLYEAHMDIIADEPKFNLYDSDWRVYSVNPNQPPQFIATQAKVNRSMINEGCMVFGEVQHSVLFHGVHVGAGSMIEDSVIMQNVMIGNNVRIKKAIIGAGTIIGNDCVIGDPNDGQIVVIGEDTTVPDQSRVMTEL